MTRYAFPLAALALAWLAAPARADESYSKVADQVNQKMVKVFGLGGFRGLESFGTGVLIDKKGLILTANSHILDTRDLRVHTADGTKYKAKVVCREPELDTALIRIEFGTKSGEVEHWFDYDAAVKRPAMTAGTPVLAFSNMFQLALRDDVMTVQHGVIASYSRLYGRMGIFQSTYRGNVYVLDAIACNPGSGGGVVTTRKGELVAIVGKELGNELTNTWINYAIPLNATTEVVDKEGKKVKASIMDMVREQEKYKPVPPIDKSNMLVVHGLKLVPNVVERTPPYIEEVVQGSPAAKTDPKLLPDDLIVYVDGIPVPDITTFEQVLGSCRPNQQIKLEIQRGDKLMTVPLTLGAPPKKETPKKDPPKS